MKQHQQRTSWLEITYIIVGALVAGFAVACFVTPAKIAGGGVNGIGTICYYMLGWDPGIVMLCLNIPLFLIGMKVFGAQYGWKSLLGAAILSVSVTLFGRATGYDGFLDYADKVDVLLSAIFGGVILGCGIGLVMRAGANTGGTDILAQILNKYTPLSLGASLFIVDGGIIAVGGYFFGLERMLFAIITLYLSSQMINFVVMDLGTKYAKTAYIVSIKHEAIGKRIVSELHHGATLLSGVGVYTGRRRTMLMAVVHNRQINALERIVHEEDPDAFMFVNETYQVQGQGFANVKVKPLPPQESSEDEQGKQDGTNP